MIRYPRSKQSIMSKSREKINMPNSHKANENLNSKGFSLRQSELNLFPVNRSSHKIEKMVSALEQALIKNELKIYYQPIISFISNKPVYFEALLRWAQPLGGLMNPSDFIPFAEKHGLIKDIGEWVIRNACLQLKDWQDRFPHDPAISVSVNISPRQLEDDGLIKVVRDILDEAKPVQGTLIFELTESSSINNVNVALEVLNSIKAMGVGISLDDYGAGYSSMKVLQRFPFDNIKLDRSYIARMFKSKKDMDYVIKSFELGLKLNKEVVAEGIETIHQQNALLDLQCKFGQGFLYSEPVISKKIDQMFINGFKWASV